MKKKLKTKEFKGYTPEQLAYFQAQEDMNDGDRGCPRCGLCGLPHGEHPQPIRWTDRDTRVRGLGWWERLVHGLNLSDIGCGGDIRVRFESWTPQVRPEVVREKTLHVTDCQRGGIGFSWIRTTWQNDRGLWLVFISRSIFFLYSLWYIYAISNEIKRF